VNVPVVINLPGAPNPRYTGDLQEADALVADGWAAQHLPATLGRTVQRVPKGVDPEQFHPDGPSLRRALRLEDKRVVVTIARLVPLKNLKLMLDAVAIVRDRVPRVHLVIVGDGPEAGALKQYAAARELTGDVTFVGYLPQRDTPPAYRAGDVFALSSDFDNSPNVLLEAMACGLPVVTTDVGGVREFVTERAGGRIVAPNNAVAFAAALEAYLNSATAARDAGAYNRRLAVTQFSWRTSAQCLLDVYVQAIDARHGGTRVSA
jgi:glycosyltransferase involved in cell wall biosynthesis